MSLGREGGGRNVERLEELQNHHSFNRLNERQTVQPAQHFYSL